MTGERVSRLIPADYTSSAQRQLHEAITGGSRASQARILPLVDEHGRLEGPFGPLLHSPELGLHVQSLGASLRSSDRVNNRTREIATLWCAAAAGNAYENAAHRLLAEQAGVSADEIEQLVEETLPESLSEHERAFALAAGLRTWDDASFARAQGQLDHGEIVEAIVLGGYYRLLAGLLDAFGITEIHGGSNDG